MCYSLASLERADDLSSEDTRALLRSFRDQGAWKLSILGGEPTRYRQLPSLIEVSLERELGGVDADDHESLVAVLLVPGGGRSRACGAS
jgi:molybdenum cofactor biosynthesis enzyme MoaA